MSSGDVMEGSEEQEVEECDVDVDGCLYQHVGRSVKRIRWADSEGRSSDFLTATCNSDSHGQICLWDIDSSPTAEEPFSLRLSADVHSGVNELLCNENGYIAALANGDVAVFDVSADSISQKSVFNRVAGKRASAEALSASEGTIACGFDIGTIATVDSRTGTVSSIGSLLAPVTSVEFLTPSTLASAHLTGQLYLWDLRASGGGFSAPVSYCDARNNACVNSLAAHPADSALVAFGTDDSYVGFWDIRAHSTVNSASLVPPLPFMGSVAEVAFHPQYSSNFYALFCEGDLIHFTVPNTPADDSWTAESQSEGSARRANPWLSSSRHAPRAKSLLSEPRSSANSFDISPCGVVISTDLHCVYFVNKNFFT